MALPPCGLYRTTRALGELAAGRLVFFHNHGDPGPGVYLPSGWTLNRATWHARGQPLASPEVEAATLAPLPPEGLYAVREAFFCCPRQCVRFTVGQLVQLGYDGEANAILFVPEWGPSGLSFPERGTKLEGDALSRLDQLQVARAADAPRDAFMH